MVSICTSPSISITKYTTPHQGSLLRSLKPFSSQKPGARIEYKLQQNQIFCAMRKDSQTSLTHTHENELLFKDKSPSREKGRLSATSSENAPSSFSTKLDVFIKFVRPVAMITIIGNTICMSILPVQTLTDLSPRYFIGVAQAITSMVLMYLFNIAVNQVFDVELDKVNKPYLPLASGGISMTSAVLFTILTGALSITLGYFSSPAMFYGLVAFFLSACAYSVNFPLLRWKHNALGAIISIMLWGISLQTSVFFHIQHYVLRKPMVLSKSFIYAIIFQSILSIAIATLKDIPDVEGDKANGSTNLTILIGKEKVFWGSTSLMLATYIGTAAFGATLPILKNKIIIMIAHSAIAVFLWLQAKQTNLADDASTQSYYLLMWKLKTIEFLLIPFVG
uniref:Flavonoid prenyltransferase n=1 Tax=Epimedium sagittatum TaxID=253616 RepID=A0A6N0C3V5_9MAGN|nr:flavonoid prenyltransferase [Epimedium sagittatum]